MTRRRRYLLWGSMMLVVATLATMLAPLSAQGATRFANAAFEQQWQSLERVIQNFYGPLSTAFDPSTEPYVEGIYNGQSGVRLVQYFDKARLEQITPDRRITSGLLTVELKTGNLQLGNDTFSQNSPAVIGIAGDPGGGGPTYADLQKLPERVPQVNGSVTLRFDPATGSFVGNTPSSDPETVFAQYISDPNGRFGQNVPKAFADFLKRIPGGYLLPMGYPITPAFTVNVRLKGVDNVPIIVQAFQRRVLTYTPTNRDTTRVEFGNIGRHYLQWRSSMGTGTVGPGTLTPPVFITNTPGATNSPGPTATDTPAPADTNATNVAGTATSAANTATAGANVVTGGTATAVVQTATAEARNATAATSSGTQTAVSVAATGTSLTATAAVSQSTTTSMQQTVTTLQTVTAGIPLTSTAVVAATQTQVSAEQTGAAVAYLTQTAAAKTPAASGSTPAQNAQQAYVPRRTPAASAR